MRRLQGYYGGIEQIVPFEDYISEAQVLYCPDNGDDPNNSTVLCPFPSATGRTASKTHEKSSEPTPYEPALTDADGTLFAGTPPVQQCFLDAEDDIAAPSIYAFNGLPQYSTEPAFGSYSVVGLPEDVCFERYGRLGPYGLGYEEKKGGTGLGLHGDRKWAEAVWPGKKHVDWRGVDLGDAQRRCYERNQERFRLSTLCNIPPRPSVLSEVTCENSAIPSSSKNGKRGMLARKAIVLRCYSDYKWTPAKRMYLRSLVNEMNLYSGGEYDVHLLVEIKPKHEILKPIWSSPEIYDEMLNATVPEEFRSMAVLWTESLMRLVYPGPFQPAYAWHGPIHWVVRSMHMALQWFALQHPEYEYYWNWEMDLRYVGHWYEFFDRTATWARQQPREGMWERANMFYMPSVHGDWDSFERFAVDNASLEPVSGPVTVPGYDVPNITYHSGYDQDTDEADFITLDPMFDPNGTRWLYINDISGYSFDYPKPPRRASIITASRLSRRLLLAMHNETYIAHHSMASEMFSLTMCLHYGLKAIYVPHPVYLEHDWPKNVFEDGFNGGINGLNSPFGGGTRNSNPRDLSYYYDSEFAGPLWRRWLGYKENGKGGSKEELQGSGRMCLRSMMLHPVKWETGQVN